MTIVDLQAVRLTKPLHESSSRLLYVLVRERGGVSYVARYLNLKRQDIWRWIKAGYVPMDHVGDLSRKLDINKFALNFEGMIKLTSEPTTWKQVVEYTVTHKSKIPWILKGKHPKKFGELVS